MFKLTALLVLVSGSAFAHDAPVGWAYDKACCSNTDCRQLSSDAVGETKTGYVIKATHELILYSDRRIKRSKDEFYHQCAIPMATHSYCLYVPDRGY